MHWSTKSYQHGLSFNEFKTLGLMGCPKFPPVIPINKRGICVEENLSSAEYTPLGACGNDELPKKLVCPLHKRIYIVFYD